MLAFLTALMFAAGTLWPAWASPQGAQVTTTPLPRYSVDELRQDFDQAIAFIDAFAVHKDLNAQRLGIDYAAEFARLRREIGDSTDLCAFGTVLERALHLVQDLHAGTMSYNYLQQYGALQSRFNIADDETYARVAAYERACSPTAPVLDLPLVFVDGQYVVYSDFSYGGETVTRGTRVVRYEGEEIAAFIRRHLDLVWPVRMTTRGEPYSTRFYRAGADAFTLGLSDGRTLALRLADSVTFAQPRTHEITYFSQPKSRVELFADERVLYIGIPMMDEELVDSINATVDRVVREGGAFDRVAIDIRGNGGGSDLTWRRVLAHLVRRDLKLSLDLRMKDTPRARARYRRVPPSPATPIELLGGARYWAHNDDTIAFDRDTSSLGFDGTIYVLRDAYIYSSAANFAVFANDDPQLVTVGEATDLVGGSQIEPLFFRLDHSGLVFRLEPALDFAQVRTLDDFAHNTVEVEIPPSVEDQHRRTTYAGDLFGREYLRRFDPLFHYVVSQPTRDARGR